MHTAEVNTGNPMNTDGGIFDAPDGYQSISPSKGKKKKKKILRKKKKKKIDIAEEDKFDPVFFDAQDEKVPFDGNLNRASIRRSEKLNSSPRQVSESKQTGFNQMISNFIKKSKYKHITLDKGDLDEDDDYEYVDKAEEKVYDGKFFCNSYKYGNRFTSMISFYNERSPRYLRVLITFNTVYIMLFTSGILFFTSGESESVNNYGPYACFGVGLFSTVVDWVMYPLLYFMFLHKPRHYKIQKYIAENEAKNLDQTNEDISEGSKSRPPTGQGQKQEKYLLKESDAEDDKKRKAINGAVSSFAVIFSCFIIVTCFVFIIIMTKKYSARGGNLWTLSLLFGILIDFVLLETYLIYKSSKFVFKRKLDVRELKFHPIPEDNFDIKPKDQEKEKEKQEVNNEPQPAVKKSPLMGLFGGKASFPTAKK